MEAERPGETTVSALVAVEQRVRAYWEAAGVPERALAGAPEGPIFRFTEGPPTANGRPHLGHAVARTLKDTVVRYHRMRGERIVTPMAGWDCHGLPVELEVEKQLGLKSKREIEAYGVDRFCAECRTNTLAVARVWEEMSQRLGYWLDYRHAYATMDPRYIESVWWSLKTLFGQRLLEKGHYVVPYCPRCETPLSSHEVAQGYRETTDPSITVRFPVAPGPGGRPRSLLVWTTTPWTLPANLLVAAHPDLTYVTVVVDGEELVLAEAALGRYFPSAPPEVTLRESGRDLAGRSYHPPFDAAGPGPGRYRVVLDAMVDAKEGTGFVHVAPSFGPDDQRIGQREGVGVFDPLDGRGVFTDKVPSVVGRSFKAADPILLRALRQAGRLYREESVRHTYPFCWRCDTPLLYRAIDTWFVRTSRATDRLVAHNAQVRWLPAHLRDGRFGNFLTEAKDWALSRNRFWGTPLPIWTCGAGHVSVVGSYAELAERCTTAVPAGFDPHGAALDRLEYRCPDCGQPARREPYTIDGWYDSGSAPFAQYHYPFEPGPFVPATPLDFVSEGLDQTRGWFYTLLVLSTLLFDRAAYRTCLTVGLVLDESGAKMSKSRGNALDPMNLLEKFGGDAVRWTFLAHDYTESARVSDTSVRQAAGRTLGTLVNVVEFYRQNALADGLNATPLRPNPSAALDRWLLSRLESTRRRATEALDDFDPHGAAVALGDFVTELSTWYLRRSRPRFWGETGPEDRREANATLSYALLVLSRLFAPLAPFTAEHVFQQVGTGAFAPSAASVHLAPWPSTEVAPVDGALELAMAGLRALVEVGRELRQQAGVKSRIPLAELVLSGPGPAALEQLGAAGERLLLEELNVRGLRRVAGTGELSGEAWVHSTGPDGLTVALPRAPTPELLEEGWFREAVRRLEQSRKEARLAYSARIVLELWADAPIFRALDRRRQRLADELLADRVELHEGLPSAEVEAARWSVEGSGLAARITPARSPPPSTPA